MKVAKWGNSLAIRIPAPIAEIMDLKVGDEIDIKVAGTRETDLSQEPSTLEMLKRLRAYRGTLPADWKFDRDEANAR